MYQYNRLLTFTVIEVKRRRDVDLSTSKFEFCHSIVYSIVKHIFIFVRKLYTTYILYIL
jgi:hypothetical protein